MARPREPIDLIVAKGRKHLTKSEYQDRKNKEIKVSSDKIKPPSFLSKKERQKFNEIASELKTLGIMSNLDCDILARYIKADNEYTKISKQLQKVKFIISKQNELSEDEQLAFQYQKYNYLYKIQSRIAKDCDRAARELGLTIASRCRLIFPEEKKEKPVNKFLA